ncbi:hypothetical protein EDB83DRAFT_2319167 [Lactarius deliciosus]|nr:hypothetical protein EDB83DRAFT_2319167 [Lactarius deliciosus]
MSSSKHISSLAPQWSTPLSTSPPPTSNSSDHPVAKGRTKSNQSHPVGVNLLAEDGNISWVEFSPPYHSHLVKSTVALVPHPVHVVKKLLNREGNLTFFNLQKGGHKANDAQKEKKCLAWKQSRAAKHERACEATKVAKLPTHEWQCKACGRKFKSCKTARKHKCTATKVESVGG